MEHWDVYDIVSNMKGENPISTLIVKRGNNLPQLGCTKIVGTNVKYTASDKRNSMCCPIKVFLVALTNRDTIV